MAKKKHPNLPNGFGSIKHLSGKRTHPYAVYPPCTERTSEGRYITPPALCYVKDWYTGFAVLSAYRVGTYTKGMEKALEMDSDEFQSIDALIQNMLSSYQRMTRKEGHTFTEVFDMYFDWKYNGKREYSASSMSSTKCAFQNLKTLHNKVYSEITCKEMQKVVDACKLKYSSIEDMVSLLKQMSKFAMAEKIIPDTTNVELLRINIPDDYEHGVAFTDDELGILWDNAEDGTVQILLIMCYSGYRIGELKVITVDLDRMCFEGGLKTDASKERIVPIHTCIQEITKSLIEQGGLLTIATGTFRKRMYKKLEQMGIERHTPHDCRHTFSRLCEKYGVRENDRKRLMGHAFNDITNSVYGHRDLEDLREQIEKICC